jgi:hypothetical protein
MRRKRARESKKTKTPPAMFLAHVGQMSASEQIKRIRRKNKTLIYYDTRAPRSSIQHGETRITIIITEQ